MFENGDKVRVVHPNANENEIFEIVEDIIDVKVIKSLETGEQKFAHVRFLLEVL